MKRNYSAGLLTGLIIGVLIMITLVLVCIANPKEKTKGTVQEAWLHYDIDFETDDEFVKSLDFNTVRI